MAEIMTEPGCQHEDCVLEHPHAGPAVLTKNIAEMSDREIAEETLTHLRNVGTFVLQFQGMSPAQLIKAMLTGGK